MFHHTGVQAVRSLREVRELGHNATPMQRDAASKRCNCGTCRATTREDKNGGHAESITAASCRRRGVALLHLRLRVRLEAAQVSRHDVVDDAAERADKGRERPWHLVLDAQPQRRLVVVDPPEADLWNGRS